jgi:hypothetical protein
MRECDFHACRDYAVAAKSAGWYMVHENIATGGHIRESVIQPSFLSIVSTHCGLFNFSASYTSMCRLELRPVGVVPEIKRDQALLAYMVGGKFLGKYINVDGIA